MSRQAHHFRHVSRYFDSIAREHGPPPHKGQYHKYHAMLIACLPPQWASKVMLGKWNEEHWQLYVEHNHEAYQLHHLLPEIGARLARKLPRPPRLKINANPGLWLAFPTRRRPIEVADGKSYSLREAETIIDRFLTRGALGEAPGKEKTDQ